MLRYRKPLRSLGANVVLVVAFAIVLVLLAKSAGAQKTPSADPSGSLPIDKTQYASLRDAYRAARAKEGKSSDSTSDAVGQLSKLTADDAANGDRFGTSVAISADTAVMGADQDAIGPNNNQGSAYVFVRTESQWSLQQKLIASDGETGDRFGYSVSISGDTIVVGAAYEDRVGGGSPDGAAYVFTRLGTSWSEQQKLIASAGADGSAFFGESVSIDGNSVVIGATGDTVGSVQVGAAYVFVRSGITWTQQQRLLASDGASFAQFGHSVGISGDSVVVGAYLANIGSNFNQGAAYVFVRSGVTWSQQQKLEAADGMEEDYFGRSVGISGDTIVVGSPKSDLSPLTNEGAAYVWVLSGGIWTQQQKIFASDGEFTEEFGYSVAISGNRIVAGAHQENRGPGSSSIGAAYLYERSGSTWTEIEKLTVFDGAGGDEFGKSIAISNETVIVGVPNKDVGSANTDEGAAYAFRKLGNNWTPETTRSAFAGEANERFGASIAMAGDHAYVGTPGEDFGNNSSQGAVYIFVRIGDEWFQQAKIVAADGLASDQFGSSLAVSGDTLLIANGNSNEAVYIFTGSGSTWSQQQKISGGNSFGTSVSISNDTLAIGAPTYSGDGAVHVYTRSLGVWTEQQVLTVTGTSQPDSRFGHSVTVLGDTIIAGEPFRSFGMTGFARGAAHYFSRTGTVWSHLQMLTQSDVSNYDRFGYSVALSGNRALIGSPSSTGTTSRPGSAYVFLFDGINWNEQQRIQGSDGEDKDLFGTSVDISGTRAIVGAPFNDVPGTVDKGSAYVFDFNGTSWAETDRLSDFHSIAGDGFGSSVAIVGGRALVAASYDDIGVITDQGSVFSYRSSGPFWSKTGKLERIGGSPNDEFGSSVAISHDTAVIGSYRDDYRGRDDAGSAFVSVRTPDGWELQAILRSDDPATGDTFGYSVSISGDTAVVGAPADDVGASTNQGSAYVFVRTGGEWTQQAQITASDGATEDLFGNSVAISGDRIVVGARKKDVGANLDQGQAYIFERSLGTWSQDSILVGSGDAEEFFGTSVAIDGNLVAVGAYGADPSGIANAGAVYVFRRAGGWSFDQLLTDSDLATGDGLGVSVAISGNTVIAGAFGDDIGTEAEAGSASIFAYSGTTWTQQSKINSTSPAAGDEFGYAVAIYGSTAIVGAPKDDVGANVDQGSGYLFARTGTTWLQQANIVAPTGAAGDEFGRGVGVFADQVIVGIPFSDGPPSTPFSSGFADRSFAPSSANQGAMVIFGNALLGPSAANVSVSGRVTTADGQGIRGARLSLISSNGVVATVPTSSLGYYTIQNIQAGNSYTLMVTTKRHTFGIPTRLITVNDDLLDVDFVAMP